MSISDTGKSSSGEKKRSRGRPRTGIGETLGLRLYPDLQADLDDWISHQDDPKPSRPEAIRQLLRLALRTPTKIKP
jgi:hypothetical protein